MIIKLRVIFGNPHFKLYPWPRSPAGAASARNPRSAGKTASSAPTRAPAAAWRPPLLRDETDAEMNCGSFNRITFSNTSSLPHLITVMRPCLNLQGPGGSLCWHVTNCVTPGRLLRTDCCQLSTAVHEPEQAEVDSLHPPQLQRGRGAGRLQQLCSSAHCRVWACNDNYLLMRKLQQSTHTTSSQKHSWSPLYLIGFS